RRCEKIGVTVPIKCRAFGPRSSTTGKTPPSRAGLLLYRHFGLVFRWAGNSGQNWRGRNARQRIATPARAWFRSPVNLRAESPALDLRRSSQFFHTFLRQGLRRVGPSGLARSQL